MTILLPVIAGGYSKLGWDPDSAAEVQPVQLDVAAPPESTGGDPNSRGPALTIAEHTQHVCDELSRAIKQLDLNAADWKDRLIECARWHDAGKAHWAFQAGMFAANPSLDTTKH